MYPSAADQESFQSMDSEVQTVDASSKPGSAVAECPLKQKDRIRIAVRDADFVLCKNQKYVLALQDGPRFEGSTGDKGVIDHLVPKGSRSATLTVWADDGPNAKPYEWDLALGKLHPITIESGVQARLHNLAFDSGEQGSESGNLAEAKEDFLSLFSSKPDDDSIEPTLNKIYGSLEPELLPAEEAWTPANYKADSNQLF